MMMMMMSFLLRVSETKCQVEHVVLLVARLGQRGVVLLVENDVTCRARAGSLASACYRVVIPPTTHTHTITSFLFNNDSILI